MKGKRPLIKANEVKILEGEAEKLVILDLSRKINLSISSSKSNLKNNKKK
jgi:hypothetical protein